MPSAARRLGTAIVWLTATVTRKLNENERAVTLVLEVPGWPGHVAGQHVDVRLTAEDGYQAERSYSIASAPQANTLWLTVERMDEGEVSPYFVDEIRAGDQFEVRGPIGGPFTWRVSDGGPLLLLAGGSGLVPLMSMLRHRAARGSDAHARLLYSVRAPEDVLFAIELQALAEDPGLIIETTLTRSAPAGWPGRRGRITAAMLEQLGPPPADRPRIFICGATTFVETAANLLLDLGHQPSAIHAERFGPSGV